MKAFIISLRRCRDRADKAVSEVNHTGLLYEVVDAYDNHDYRSDGEVDWDRLHRELPFTNDNWGAQFMASEVCCYHSHLECYRRILKQGLRRAFIMEDDFCLVEAPYGFQEVASQIDCIPEWFHCCLHNNLPGTNVNHRVIGKLHPMFLQVRETPLITLGYAVTDKFCKFMLENHAEMDSPIDHVICRTSRDPQHIFLQTVEPICSDVGFTSTQE